MSLISTSSTTQQEAYLFENHYPQPIVIAPNSQICLQKFIHYRGALYEVSTQNNTIGYRFGSASPAANAKAINYPGNGRTYTTSSTNDFSFGTGDFTVECWVRFNTNNNQGVFQLSQRN